MRLDHITAALALVALLVSTSPALAGGSPEELFHQGRGAIIKKDWQAAYRALTESWALKKSFDTAALLGQTELKLGKHRDAAEHFAFALKNFPNRDPAPDARKRIEEGYKTAREKVFTVRLEVKPLGAEVRVGGNAVGRAPLETEVFMEPGTHLVEASLEGYESEKREVVATAGGNQAIQLELAKTVGAAPTAGAGPGGAHEKPSEGSGAHDAGTPQKDGASSKGAFLIAGGGLTLLSLGVGIGFGLDSQGAKSDADELSSKLGAGGCADSANTKECGDLSDKRDRANRNATIATVGFVGAGVFAAATAVVWLAWPEGQRKSASGVQLAPTIGRVSGLAVRGQF